MEKINLCYEFLAVLFFVFLAAGITALCIVVPLGIVWSVMLVGCVFYGCAAAIKNTKEEIGWRIRIDE